MKMSYEDYETTSVLTLSGELMSDQTDNFRRSCQDRIGSGIHDMVLDMQYLTLVDSTGLEALLWLTEELGEHGGQLRLVKPDEVVMSILKVTRLDRRFDVHPTIESAAKSLR